MQCYTSNWWKLLQYTSCNACICALVCIVLFTHAIVKLVPAWTLSLSHAISFFLSLSLSISLFLSLDVCVCVYATCCYCCQSSHVRILHQFLQKLPSNSSCIRQTKRKPCEQSKLREKKWKWPAWCIEKKEVFFSIFFVRLIHCYFSILYVVYQISYGVHFSSNLMKFICIYWGREKVPIADIQANIYFAISKWGNWNAFTQSLIRPAHTHTHHITYIYKLTDCVCSIQSLYFVRPDGARDLMVCCLWLCVCVCELYEMKYVSEIYSNR